MYRFAKFHEQIIIILCTGFLGKYIFHSFAIIVLEIHITFLKQEIGFIFKAVGFSMVIICN
jgi:hypothetical protein